MYVVTVDFFVKPTHLPAFREEILKNARTSLDLEPGCHQFDVTVSKNDPTHIFLYEIYDDAAAFSAHLQTTHFKQFSATVADWVENKQARMFVLLPQPL
jgi:autoinducer 2-degrading protein